jgi:hypothetical protein
MHMLAPGETPGTFPAMTMCQFVPWSASFRPQLVPAPGTHPPAPTRFSDTPDPRTRSSSRCTPVEPAPSSYTYMGSPGLPGPAGPATSVSGVSSSPSWRRSPDLLGFWRDRGAAGCRHHPCGIRPELLRDLVSPWPARIQVPRPGRCGKCGTGNVTAETGTFCGVSAGCGAWRRGNVVTCAKAGTRRPPVPGLSG